MYSLPNELKLKVLEYLKLGKPLGYYEKVYKEFNLKVPKKQKEIQENYLINLFVGVFKQSNTVRNISVFPDPVKIWKYEIDLNINNFKKIKIVKTRTTDKVTTFRCGIESLYGGPILYMIDFALVLSDF